MRNWKVTIDVDDLWDRKVGPRMLALLVIERFRDSFAEGVDIELDYLLDELEFAAEDKSFSVDDFDDLWEQIYDWADEKSVWINC